MKRIRQLTANKNADDAVIAIRSPEATQRFMLNKEGAVAELTAESILSIAATCMAKLYTATLAIEKFAEKNVSLDTRASDLLVDLHGGRSLPALDGGWRD